MELERSTLADWVAGCSNLLDPLVEELLLRRYVMAAGKLHADAARVPVHEKGTGARPRQGVCGLTFATTDQRDTAAPAVWFAYSPDRGGEHPQQQHLRTFRGALQADAYAGFNQLYKDDRIQEVACWAHVRRSSMAATRRTTTSSPNTNSALASVFARLARSLTDETLPQVGYDGGDSLCAYAVAGVDPVLRRWTPGDRQQRRRTFLARRNSGSEKLFVRRVRCRGERAAILYSLIRIR